MKDFYDLEYGEEVYIDEDGNEYRLLTDEYGQEFLSKIGDAVKGTVKRVSSTFERGKIEGAVGARTDRDWGERQTGAGFDEDHVDPPSPHLSTGTLSAEEMAEHLKLPPEEAKSLLSSIVSFAKGHPVKSSLAGLVALGGPAVVTLMHQGGRCKDVLRNFFKGKATVQEVKQAAAADGFLYRNGKWIAAGAGTLGVAGGGAYYVHRRHDKRR